MAGDHIVEDCHFINVRPMPQAIFAEILPGSAKEQFGLDPLLVCQDNVTKDERSDRDDQDGCRHGYQQIPVPTQSDSQYELRIGSTRSSLRSIESAFLWK